MSFSSKALYIPKSLALQTQIAVPFTGHLLSYPFSTRAHIPSNKLKFRNIINS